ncbi:hypothetical protein RQM65_18320 [Pricia sp. S334]|uniref:Type VI secretion system baseplate subunit TssG n=1 Tax=Pricia mediterranea TaxID=3076079 RepID=A0ABU3LA63_9FLAO|nr:hypothetical protein [Pricia sp. S334]MDT7830631.1 hypothetical protein [Pricia sp. S334]
MKQKNCNPPIRQQVLELGFDLKAELFAARLMENEVDLNLNMTDYFKRGFSKDITHIEEANEDNKVEVHLSRRSFYDIFPERFFHSPNGSTTLVKTMVANYKNRKLEEEQVRKFFKPLETEFFLHRVAIENEEDQIFRSLDGTALAELLRTLWKLDTRIPEKTAVKIIKTMPLLYKIAGNLPLIQKVLENIIDEEVTVGQEYACVAHQPEDAPWQLGVNMAISGPSQSFLPKYRFTMTEISRPEAIEDYLPDGKISAAVRFFLEHTLPFESEFEIDFTIPEAKRQFTLGSKVYEGRLDISSTI